MLTTSHSPVSEASWPASALTRAWVVWQNGFKKTLHSFDSSGRYQVANPMAYGIKGFRTRILDAVWPSPIKELRIYDNQTGALLEVWVQNGVRLV